MKVCAILLTADRQDYTDRAVECFMSQTYQDKELLILDTGKTVYNIFRKTADNIFPTQRISVAHFDNPAHSCTIGGLRNWAIALAESRGIKADVIMHLDSDDWSAPTRMADQVAVLEANPHIEATGYTTMIFWDAEKHQSWHFSTVPQNQSLGTALCYRRSAWEAKPFPDTSMGEDTIWQRGLKMLSYPSRGAMIADLHLGNTCSRIVKDSVQWKRVMEWDEYCRHRSLAAYVEGRK